MLANSGQVKVMDFGLARVMGSSHVTLPGNLIGTFAYMSPEQIDEADVDARSDIFSFGTLLYQMATGELPFKGKTVAELLSAIARKNPEMPRRIRPEIPEGLERIILKAMEKDTKRRYHSIVTLRDDLAQLQRYPKSGVRSVQENFMRRYRVPVFAGVALIILLGGYGIWGLRNDKDSSPSLKSIAVLPFINEQQDESINFLSIGFADDIITRLSFIRSLLVLPTSAVASYEGTSSSLATVGSELNTEYVLQGRFRRAGDRFSVSAQLVDSRTGYLLWGDEVNFPWNEAQAIQENVANRIVEALELKLSENEYTLVHKVRTGNAEAYEFFLRGKALTLKDSREHNDLAMKMFERSIVLDERFAEAYAALGNVYVERFWSNYSSDTSWVGKGERMARRALSLDNRLASAHASLAFALRVLGNYPASVREAALALEFDPHTSFSLEDLSEFHRNRGEFDVALAYAKRAFAVDPSFNIYRVRARIYHFQGKYLESITDLETAIRRSPNDSWLRGGLLAMTYVYLGDLKRAEEQIKIAETIDFEKPETRVTRAMVFTMKNDFPGAEAELQAINDFVERDYALAFLAAQIYARQHNVDRALDMLERSFILGNRWYAGCSNPWFDNVREVPRFQSLVGRMKGELDEIAAGLPSTLPWQ